MPEVIQPFALTYIGNDADRHELNAQSLGISLIGAAKLYNAVAHYCAFGYVPHGNYKKEFQCYAKIPKDGSYEYFLYIAAIAQEYNLYGEFSKEAMGFVFANVIDALKGHWTKPGETGKVVEHLTNALIEQSKDRKDVEIVLANGIIHANDNMASLHGKLIDTLPQLADATRPSAKELVTPVGNTCKKIEQFSNTSLVVPISEPEAEVIRGDEDYEVDEMQNFNCNRITEVDIENGHCKLDIEGLDHMVIGKIDDPIIHTPNNIYTRALNEQKPFTITAKPVKKQGIIHRLYISDAKENDT